MSTYTDRVGQQIGTWTVVEDVGRSKSAQRVIWKLVDGDGVEKYLHTYALIAMDRATSKPSPPSGDATLGRPVE